MPQIRIRHPRVRREHRWHRVLPPGRRDPDVVTATALARAGGKTARRSRFPAVRCQVHCVMLTDIRHWQQATRAHAERFAQVRPATIFIEVRPVKVPLTRT